MNRQAEFNRVWAHIMDAQERARLLAEAPCVEAAKLAREMNRELTHLHLDYLAIFTESPNHPSWRPHRR